MMNRIVSIIFIFVACTNETQNCQVDSQYFQLLLTVNEYRKGNEKISPEQFDLSLRYLETITGIKDNVYRGDFFAYASDIDYYSDLEKWTEWYYLRGKFLDNHKLNRLIEESEILSPKEKKKWPKMFTNALND
jgi:hypothetical protein